MKLNAIGIPNFLSGEQESKTPYRSQSAMRSGEKQTCWNRQTGTTMHSKKTSLIFLLVCVLVIISVVFILRSFRLVILSIRLMFILGGKTLASGRGRRNQF